MQFRNFPPTRKSILQTGVVKPFGPHQRIARSGSDQALNTSSSGASKTRVMTSACSSAVVGVFFAAICFLLLCLCLGQVIRELVERSIEAVGHAIEAGLESLALL